MIKFIKAQYKAWHKARAISRFKLDNRKAKKKNVWEETGDKEYFVERLEILIKKCEHHHQLYRLQQILNAKYAPFNGKWDGWIFFGCRMSIVLNSIKIRVDSLEMRINRIERALG
jgi:hypothetical protein